MRAGSVTLTLLLALLYGFVAADTGDTRRGNKTTIEKVLDPLPNYDPFDYSVPAPAYFPDEVDKQARQVLIDALLDRPEKLKEHVARFKAKDQELTAERGTVSGLTPHITDLYHNTISDREEYLEKQREALAATSSDSHKRVIRARLRHDELEQADSLMTRSQMNRWGALLNRLLGSMDLITIASGNYISAAVDTAFAELKRARIPHMPVAERKALALYKRFVEKFPDDPRRQDALEKIESLTKDKKKVWVYQRLKKAKQDLNKGHPYLAEFETDLAAMVDPEADSVTDRFEDIDEVQQESEAARAQTLSVAAADPLASLSTEQADEVRALLYHLVKRDAAAIEAQANRLTDAFKGQTLGDLATDALAVAMEIRGEHEKAKEKLGQVARSSASDRDRKRARVLLDSPVYNHLSAVDRARMQHRLNQVKFVLLGEDFLEKNLMVAIAPMITHGVAGASSLGAANIMMVSNNLLQVLSSNPVSNQDVIDSAAEFLRVRPDSKKAGEVYKVMGDAYDSRGHFNKALHYYKLSGKLPAEEIQELEEDAGNKLMRVAKRKRSKSEKRRIYRAILELYPATAAADEAKGKLARLVRLEHHGLRLSKRFLMEHPALYGPRSLGLKATLFDGNTDNMEVAGKGLSVVDKRTVLLHYDTPWGVQQRKYSVDDAKIARFKTVLREEHYELAGRDVDRRGKNSRGGFKNLPEQLTRLEPRRDDVDLRFFRDAQAAKGTYPTVIGHELLSEKETNPQKGYGLPNIRGSITTSGISLSGDIPASFLGNELVIGNDVNSPYAGLRIPIPFFDEFVPVDFMIRARPGGPSVTPRLRTQDDTVEDAHLYR